MDLYDVRNSLNTGQSIFDLSLKVAYYARVSTDKDEQLHSIKTQIEYYEQYIRSNVNWTFVDGYIDEGLSGTSVSKRESFLRMIEDGRLGKFDFIITKEISRFSRNTLDSIQYTQRLLSYGVGVFFQSDNINTLMPDAELRLTIMSSIAQEEVRKLSDRVKFGFKRSIEKGVVLGSSRIWGYKKNKGKLEIVEEEAEIVRKIFDMYSNQGLGMHLITKELSKMGYKNTKGNDFSTSSVTGIISNPKYKGFYCGNKTHKYDYKLSNVKVLDSADWVMYKDETGEIVPAIVSEETWEKANLILSQRRKKQSCEDTTVYQSRYPYSGKIICMQHNTSYYRANYKYKSGNKEVWHCRIYSQKGKAGCNSPILYTSEIDEIMKQAANYLIANKVKIIHDLMKLYSDSDNKSKAKNDVSKHRTEINSILKLKDKLLDLSVMCKITDDEFELRNNKFNAEMVVLDNKILEIEKTNEKNAEVINSIGTLRSAISNELDFENGFCNNLINSLLERIEVYQTEEKNTVNLKVFFKAMKDGIPFSVLKKKDDFTSFSYTPYILCRQILPPR